MAVKVKIFTFFLIAFLNICSAKTLHITRDKLIIDQDGGADDAMAIFMALLAQQCFGGPEVVAITTTHGNVDEDQSFINTQKILDVAGRTDVPIFRGSNDSLILDVSQDHYFGNDGLGDMKGFEFKNIPDNKIHAAIALLELSKIYKGELVVVSLGAVTNIALAIRLDKHFLGRLKHLYLGAGHIQSERFNKPEFNAEQDAEAYYIAVQKAKPDKVTVIPFSQVLATMNVTKEWRVNTLGSINRKIINVQNKFERISMSRINDGIWGLLDPVAMAIYLDQNVIEESKYSNNSIILHGTERGLNTNKFGEKSESNVKIIYSMNNDFYKKLLIRLFSEC